MDKLLEEIRASTEATKAAVATLRAEVAGLDTAAGMSLLALKNETLLEYVHSSALVLLSQLAVRGLLEKEDVEAARGVRAQAIKGTIAGRVVLEKGVKGLESRVSYEIDKALRNYEKVRAEKEKEEESDEESDEEEAGANDLLAFKPNPMALLAAGKPAAKKPAKKITKIAGKGTRHTAAGSDDEEEEPSDAGSDGEDKFYKAPKISATLPTGAAAASLSTSRKPASRLRKNEMLEEYLQESSAAPQAEASIGSTIVDAGRSVRNEHDRRREREIRDYEENNYTRLTEKTKEKHRGKKRSAQDSFLGEEWDFSGKRSYDATKKKRGSASVWEKASKRKGR